MKGLIAHPKIKEEDLDKLILSARKTGPIRITFITPHNKSTVIMLEVNKQQKGWFRVCMDTHSSNWDISLKGQENFKKYERNIPDSNDRKEVFCRKRIMRIDTKETGEGMVLAYILKFLEDGENLEEIKIDC